MKGIHSFDLSLFNIRKHTEQTIFPSPISYALLPLGILNPHLEHSWSLYMVTVLTTGMLIHLLEYVEQLFPLRLLSIYRKLF